jgi:hypothetical protein
VRCIRCDHDSTRKERTSRHCPRCGGAFAFEPGDNDPLTDVAFQAAIDRVSGHGRIRWGVEHLYYEICRRQRREAVKLKGLIPVLVLGVASGVTYWLVWWLSALLGAVAVIVALRWIARRSRTTVAVTVEDFNRMWGRWREAHGDPEGVIIRRPAPPPPREREPDIADYSFDRAVICDRARTVDLLLANSFHFENNCAVLSVGGYPAGPFATVKAMLRRNPKLQVFVLHDATPTGCRLAHVLARDPEWFRGHARVVDVGLRPVHARALRGLWLPSRVPSVEVGNGVTASDARWLSAHLVELAAIRPEQVLKRLYRAINGRRDDAAVGVDADGEAIDDAPFSTDAADGESDGDGFG